MIWLPAGCLIVLAALILLSAPNPNPPLVRSLPSEGASILHRPGSGELLIGRVDGVLAADGNQSIKLGSGRISQLTASSKGDVISAVMPQDGLIQLVSSDLQLQKSFPVEGLNRGAISTDGGEIAIGRIDGTVSIVPVTTEDGATLEPPHLKLVTVLTWSPSGRYLASGSQAGTVFVWDVTTRRIVLQVAEPHSTILQIGFDANENSVIVVHFDQTVSRFELASQSKIAQRQENSHARGAIVSTTADSLVTFGRRGRVTIRNESGNPQQVLQYIGPTYTCGSVWGNQLAVTGAAEVVAEWNLNELRDSPFTTALMGTFLISLLATIVVSLQDWRTGLLYCVLLDAMRDPVRKLLPEAPIWVTLCLGAMWLMIMFLASREHLPVWRNVLLKSRIRVGFLLIATAILTAALIKSLLLYPAGLQLVLLGTAAYCSPVIGILIGLSYLRSPIDLQRLAVVYVLGNLVFCLSAFAEYHAWDWRGLEGIEFDWIRYRSRGLISLMCGFYRSPTVLGIHAAGMVMYGTLLAWQSQGKKRYGWLGTVAMGLIVVLISGRRKMQLIVVLFLLTIGVAVSQSVLRLHQRTVRTGIVLVLLGVGILAMLPAWQGVLPDYLRYALTLGHEGLIRSLGLFNSVYVTLHQNGIWGLGLGTATQGSYYLRGSAPRSWQEDGLSRIAAELGLPGLLLFATGTLLLARSLIRRVATAKPNVRRTSVLLAAMTVGYFGSYIAAHMTYSGDVSTSILSAMPLGMLLALAKSAADNGPAGQ